MLLFFLALGNLVLTFIILGVLRLGQGRHCLLLSKEFLESLTSAIMFYYVLVNLNLHIVFRNGKPGTHV